MTEVTDAFIKILIADVIVAGEHLSEGANQARRRNYIRTTVAAMEGVTWSMRDHVLRVGMDLERLSPLHALALRDVGYSVSDKGRLKPIPQYIPLQTAIRYAVRCAQAIAPELRVDYGQVGWSHLANAIQIRHRITHPKTEDALAISEADLTTTSSALLWLLATTEEVMHATTGALREHSDEMKTLLVALKRGDPEALQLYHKVWLRGDTE